MAFLLFCSESFLISLWPRLSIQPLVLMQLELKLLHRAEATTSSQATNTVSPGPGPSIDRYYCYPFWCLTLMCVSECLYKHDLLESSHEPYKLDMIISIL